MRVLVIDDSRAMRSILSKIMSEIGFDVVAAAHGREGLERLREDDGIGLVLVDWNLPEMNGYEFVQAVRADPAYDDVRLIMVSTETERERVLKALDAGVDEYVMKPFTRATIVEKLAFLGLADG
ncbi:MAG: response regulator [Acidobacteria bacterium]|jgi:two-component system, chemotaxis family, chemotaxis protein CheY|nr:response regulator [Acidobacteriota bacterium]